MKAFSLLSITALFSLLCLSISARAANSYSVAGSTITENFDGLPTDAPGNASIQTTAYLNGWMDDSSTVAGDHVGITGWYLYHPLAASPEGGSNTHQRMRFGPGANTGAFWAFGSSASATDKALGTIGSTTTAANGANMYMAWRLVNNTGSLIDSFTLTYDGEEWRDGQSTSGETLSFDYSLTASTADWNSTAVFNSVSALNFTSPVVAGTGSAGTAVDGNTAGLVANISSTITGIAWAPGTELWLRWADPQLASNADDGLAIDNVRFVGNAAVPEPTTGALGVMSLLSLAILRRVRKV